MCKKCINEWTQSAVRMVMTRLTWVLMTDTVNLWVISSSQPGYGQCGHSVRMLVAPLIPSLCISRGKTFCLKNCFFFFIRIISSGPTLLQITFDFPQQTFYPLFLTSKKNCHNLPCLSTLTSSNTEIRYKIKIKDQPKGENNKKNKKTRLISRKKERFYSTSILRWHASGSRRKQIKSSIPTYTDWAEREERGKERGRLRHTAMRKRVRANDGIDPDHVFFFSSFSFGQRRWAKCWEHALVTCWQRCDVTWVSNHQFLVRGGHVSVIGLNQVWWSLRYRGNANQQCWVGDSLHSSIWRDIVSFK